MNYQQLIESQAYRIDAFETQVTHIKDQLSQRDARITALETALAAMTAERDSLQDAVHLLNTMNDEQNEWFTRIVDDHGGWHEDLPTGEAHVEEIIGNLKKERDARDVAVKAACRVAFVASYLGFDTAWAASQINGIQNKIVRDEMQALARAAVEGER